MIWLGIGIGVGIGSLVIVAFWLGQRSASVVQAESREVVTSQEPPVVTPKPDEVPEAIETPRPEEPISPPKPDAPPTDVVHAEPVLDEPEAEVPVPDAAALKKQIAHLLEENKPLEPATDPRTRRRWVGTDATLCGAINGVRETFPTGTRGVFRYTGSPADGWRTQFSLGEDDSVSASEQAPPALMLIQFDEFPDLLDSAGWLDVFTRTSAGGIRLESPSWPEEHNHSQDLRLLLGMDKTFCGAVNSVRDTHADGGIGWFSFVGNAARAWMTEFIPADDHTLAGLRSRLRTDEYMREEYWEDPTNWWSLLRARAEYSNDPNNQPLRNHERRNRDTFIREHKDNIHFVVTHEPTTANYSRGGLDKFGENEDSNHLGTWRDDLWIGND